MNKKEKKGRIIALGSECVHRPKCSLPTCHFFHIKEKEMMGEI